MVGTCFCEDSSATCTPDVHGGDDRCEFLQGGVGVLSRHGGDTHTAEVGRDDVKKHAGAKDDAAGIPDIISKITGILNSASASEKAFEDVKKEMQKFRAEVAASTKDVIVHVKASMLLPEAMTQVDNAYDKIWKAAKKVLLAIQKAHHDITSGMPWIPMQFRSYLNTTLNDIEAKGDDFAMFFKVNMTWYSRAANKTAACAKLADFFKVIKNKASNFAKSAIGLSTDGIKKEAKNLYKLLPANAQKEVDKLLAKANDVAQHIMGDLPKITQEIVDRGSQALQGHCSNLVKSNGHMQTKVGLVASCVVSAVALLL